MPTIDYPRVNGVRPDFASVQLSLISDRGSQFPVPLIGFQSISYEEVVAAPSHYLTGPRPVARNRGRAVAGGRVEWLMEEARVLMAWLASQGVGGFSDAIFDVNVTVRITPTAKLITDVLGGVRFLGAAQSVSLGGGALTTTTPLAISGIGWGTASGYSVPSLTRLPQTITFGDTNVPP